MGNLEAVTRRTEQNNDQKKKDKTTNSDLQNNTQKGKDWATRIQLTSGVQLRYARFE